MLDLIVLHGEFSLFTVSVKLLYITNYVFPRALLYKRMT